MYVTVLADCVQCGDNVEFKHEDCDHCLEKGEQCDHYSCVECGGEF